MIIFHEAGWKNFLAYGNYWTKIELDSTKTTFLSGKSGSGKSTLLDLLCFVLFNKSFRAINKNQLINSINGRDCIGYVSFSISGKKYTVKRGIRPNIFEIWCDDSLLNQDSASRDYQSYLEKQILKFNFKSFVQIVLLGPANFTPFMQLRPNDRRLIIEELLDIEVFSIMSVLLRKQMSELKTKLSETDLRLDLAKEKISIFEEHLRDLKSDVSSQIAEKKKALREETLAIEREQEKIEQLKLNRSECMESISDQTKVSDLLLKLENFALDFSKKKRKLESEIDFYQSNDSCPSCKQSIDDSFRLKEIEKKCHRKSELEDGLSKLAIKQKITEQREKEIDAVLEQIRSIDKQISILKNNISFSEKVKQKILKDLEKLNSPKSSIEAESGKIHETKLELENLSTEKEELIHKKHIHEMAGGLLTDAGVKARIIKQYLPLINKQTNKFLAAMDFFVSFNIDEEFNEQIKSRGRDEFTYASFSEGQRQRIDLALLFAWRAVAKSKNSLNTNLLILDEVMDSSLDLEATESVLEMFRGDLFENSNIFVISHKPTIADKFDRSIEFELKSDFSYMK